MKIYVWHGSYGCGTGCCGHIVQRDNDQNFEFEHPYGENHVYFAKRLVAETYGEEHVKDLDWGSCTISED